MGKHEQEEREDAYRFNDERDERRAERTEDEPQHHQQCHCDDCRPHVRHDAASIAVNRATDEVTYPCGRAVYSPDDDGATHTGAYGAKYVTCFGCFQAREARIAQATENERRRAEWFAMTPEQRDAELKR